MSNLRPLRDVPGVLTSQTTAPLFVSALFVNSKETEVQALTADGIETFKVDRVDEVANSDRLVLVSKTVKYNWRPPREADGIWLSSLRVPIPVEAMSTIATGDEMENLENLSAYSSGDSPYVLGVVYTTPDGRWVRSSGSFLPIAEDDTTYADMDRIDIDPARSKDFLDLYDRNYVTVSDAIGFEQESAE